MTAYKRKVKNLKENEIKDDVVFELKDQQIEEALTRLRRLHLASLNTEIVYKGAKFFTTPPHVKLLMGRYLLALKGWMEQFPLYWATATPDQNIKLVFSDLDNLLSSILQKRWINNANYLALKEMIYASKEPLAVNINYGWV